MNKDFLKYVDSIPNITKTEVEDYIKWMNKFHGMYMSNSYNIVSQIDGFHAMTPNIIEENPKHMAVLDVFSRLMRDRIIFMGCSIDSQIANIIVSQFLYLSQNDNKKDDISLYINSPGGEVYSGLSIYGTMRYIEPDVKTITTGMAASMAYVLATAGTKGKRAALPFARFMQHQPLGGAQGQATDINITNKEIHKLKYELYEIISEHTGQEFDTILADCERDYWMRADEAIDYGACDHILSKDGFAPTSLKEEKWKTLMDA